MNENNNILQQMRTTFEELEKRIKSLERATTANAQVVALNSCITEIKTLLEDFEQKYEAHISEYNSHIQEFDTFKTQIENGLESNINVDNNQSLLINNTLTSLNQLRTTISSLNQKVTSLEQSQGGEVESTDYEKLYLNLCTLKDKMYLPRISIFGDISHMIDVQISINLTRSSQTNSTALTYSAYINGTKHGDYNISCELGATTTVEFTHKFTNNNTLNYFDFVINNANKSQINFVEVVVKGKNVKIYSIMSKKMSICCFSNKYYIVSQDELGKVKFCEIEKSQLDNYQEYLTEIDKFNINSYPTKFDIIPITKKTSQGTLENDLSISTNGLIAVGNTSDPISGFYLYTYSGDQFSKKTGYTILSNNFDSVPYTENLEGMSSVIPLTENNGVIIFELKQTGNISYTLKLNNEKVDKSLSATFVRDNSLGYASTCGGVKGILVTDENTMITYYPCREATYKVDIAKGKNTTAYIQPNGNINVYISTNKVVKKYVLCLDPTTNKYQLQGETKEFVGITSYEELYDNKALVYTYDDYKIIDNQEF